MAKVFTISLCLALPFAMSGCAAMDVLAAPLNATVGFLGSVFPKGGGEEKPEEKKEDEAPQRMVGTIRFSYEGFVLIYSPTNEMLPPGTKLTTISKEGAAQDTVLKLSAEKKGSFLVADIVKGDPKSGHLVVTQKGGGTAARSEYQVLP